MRCTVRLQVATKVTDWASPTAHETLERVEKLGLRVTIRGLLVVDWVAPCGPWDDQISFIFNGGPLAPDQAARLILQVRGAGLVPEGWCQRQAISPGCFRWWRDG